MSDTPPDRSTPREPPAQGGAGPPDPDAGHRRLEESAMWNAVAYLISGPVVFGALGWFLDRWLSTGFLVVVGIVGGMAMSLYLVWFRYGTEQK